MNYYNEIKKELIDNELNKKVKDYSKNKYEIQKYYNVGKLLLEAGNNYGEGIIKEYSKKLTNEIGKKYSVRYLFDIRKLYLFAKVHPVGAQLTMSHYRLLFPLNDDNEIDYYINQIIKRNLSKRELEVIIKSNEYGRLPEYTKNKLIKKEKSNVVDFVKSPIQIKNNWNNEIISEKILQKLILEDISYFLEELGEGFTFIKNEYKIKINDRYNYIDLLLYNIKYKCYVVIELKVTELKKEHTGQIMTYMNYIDKNIKTIEENDTVGIIICKQDNEYVIKYCSDDRIIAREYELL
jgi:predicted nuclease of restriction endonuclease-like (RecB) superfamily